jgi:hypothetical protein
MREAEMRPLVLQESDHGGDGSLLFIAEGLPPGPEFVGVFDVP